MRKFSLGWFSLLVLMTAGCGEGTDPYQILANPSQVPVITLPIEAAKIQNVTSSTRDRLELTTVISSAFNLTSPVNGYVSGLSVDGATSTYTISIFYNSSFSIQISNIATTPLVRLGERVVAGQILSSSSVAQQVFYTTYFNGTATCPWIFLAVADRDSLRSKLGGGGVAPCP